ncbi:MAG TPA: flagellar hook-length control protein FliK [Beijerinckiaceae bacterium]|jgi:flagellar hook-length control protein FliK
MRDLSPPRLTDLPAPPPRGASRVRDASSREDKPRFDAVLPKAERAAPASSRSADDRGAAQGRETPGNELRPRPADAQAPDAASGKKASKEADKNANDDPGKDSDKTSEKTAVKAPAETQAPALTTVEEASATAGEPDQLTNPLTLAADASAGSASDDALALQALTSEPAEAKETLAEENPPPAVLDGSGVAPTAQPAEPLPIPLPGMSAVPAPGRSVVVQGNDALPGGQAPAPAASAAVQGTASAGVPGSAEAKAAAPALPVREAGSDKVSGPDALSLGQPTADGTHGSFAADLSAFASSAPPTSQGSAATGGIGQGPAAVQSAPTANASTPPVPLGAVPIEIGLRSLQGSTRFEVRLDPAELGRIDVRLDIDDEGKVKAHLTVERIETLNLLQRDARSLERAFEQAGLKPSDGGIDYTLRDQSSGRGGQGQPGARTSPGDGAPAVRDDTNPVLPPERLLRRGAAGIDLRI